MDEYERQARRAVVAALAVLATAVGKEMSDEQIDIYINGIAVNDSNQSTIIVKHLG